MTAAEILERVRISDVAEYLGVKLDRSRRRGVASWREGRNFSISFNDAKNVWHDFVTGEGGGVVDFVVRVRGCDRKTALEWLALYAGVPLDDKPPSPERRKRWAQERCELERIRLDASYFADAAALLAEGALEELSPTDPERAVHAALLAALRVSPEAEYRSWLRKSPAMAAALVYAGRERSKRLQIALAQWIVLGMPGVADAA